MINELITRDDLLALRESFGTNFKEGASKLSELSVTDEKYKDVAEATMYSLQNVFGIEAEITRVDNLKKAEELKKMAEKDVESPTTEK